MSRRCWRRVVTVVRIRSTNRLPASLWVPKLRRRHNTALSNERLNSAKGSLPSLVCRTVHAGFLAHGSSSRTAFVISTIPLRTITTASMYLVVTVTMDRHQIAIGVIPAVLITVMDFEKRLWQEDEVTMSTATVLFL